MSLSRIDGWSRAELVREANRMGIERPEDLSRAELVRVLLRADRKYRKPPSALGTARAIFHRVVDLARTAIPRGQEAPRESAPAWTPSTRPSRPASAPVSADGGKEPEANGAPEPNGTHDASASDASAEAPPTAAAPRETAPREARSPEEKSREEKSRDGDELETKREKKNGKKKGKKKRKARAEKETKASTGKRDKSPRGDEVVPDDEPIQTRTMARLLTDQGYHQRALAIYAKLRQEHPDDELLAREQAEIDAKLAEAASQKGDDSVGGGEVAAVAVDDRTLLVSWEVDERGVDRATDVLGETGALTARLMITAPDPGHVVMTESRDRNGVSLDGEWLVRDLPAGARVTASIGLLRGSRFVSIAHAPPVELALRE